MNQQNQLFRLKSPFKLRGDQPEAVKKLQRWVEQGNDRLTLLGVTGSGKTFTMANVIERIQRPVLLITHNKTLAAQLYTEFKEFFPENAVEYFVSYYDYYQPEAYIPSTDSYIEKDSSINEQIDRFRHSATTSLFSRRDVLVVASVSCIFGLGSPADYSQLRISLEQDQEISRQKLIRDLIKIQYSRNDMDFHRSRFRARGETVDIFPASSEIAIRVKFFGDEIEKIEAFDPLTGEVSKKLKTVDIFPAQHFVTTKEKLEKALGAIEAEMKEQVLYFEKNRKLIEAQRIYERTRYDLEMMRETGFCKGIENYSRHLAGRAAGEPPDTLVDYLPKDCLIILDESHMTVPQLKGMYRGDRSRKQTLVDFGFRLPSAIDNRCLTFEEFLARKRPLLFVSATPGPYELESSQEKIAEQLIRPTGLLDPKISVVKSEGQIDFLINEIEKRIEKNERVLITTLTKKMAQELSAYLTEMNIPTGYLHDEIDTLERIEILRDLRVGTIKVLVGINLLREGLDLPEVSLVAILDADKEGFLRSSWSLMQTCGRAARNANGEVILFADRISAAMKYCIEETNRRRSIQEKYNLENGIEPATIIKQLPALFLPGGDEKTGKKADLSKDKFVEMIKTLKMEMEQAAARMEFEKAAMIRDEIIALQEENLELGVLSQLGQALKSGREKGVAKKRSMRNVPAAQQKRKPKKFQGKS
ncbi:MAG: excinuclease subunit [Clostridiales bacterium]|jgi:excinuclease ABC subunit B|nr:excinuclease subunit [Clostridiales bacterium]MDN5283534.1 excinuclease subunit [Candidatus Ozemobacter sp.]